jgi:hypothetical protein
MVGYELHTEIIDQWKVDVTVKEKNFTGIKILHILQVKVIC